MTCLLSTYSSSAGPVSGAHVADCRGPKDGLLSTGQSVFFVVAHMVDFSLFSVLECPEGRAPQDVYREMLALFAYSEELGFRGAWVAEHHFSDYGTLGGPAVFLSALAARTNRLRLGSAISVLPFHDPIRVAEDFSTVDVISGGRLDFGVGRGYQPQEFRGFGIDMSEARGRFLEALDVIDMAWRDGYVDHRGQYYRYDDLKIRPEPVQSPVPVYIASVSPETFQLVRESGRHIMGSLLTNAREQLSEKLSTHRATLPLRDRGRVRMPVMTPVYVAESNDAAYREAMPEYTWYWDTVGKLLPKADDKLDDSYAYFRKLAERTSGGRDDIARAMARWPIGDADRVTNYLIDLARNSTCDEIICFASLGAMDFCKAAKNLERIAGDVMPRVRAALAEDDAKVALA